MMLRFDPLKIFRSSSTPAGLYARQHWLSEGETVQWRHDFDSKVAILSKGQSPVGCWSHSLIDTIRHLFYLHLTVREQTEVIKAGLDWLLNATLNSPTELTGYRSAKLSISELRGLPFTTGHSGFFLKAASIFLATVFGRDNNERVLATFDMLDREGIQTGGRWRGWSSLTNILRAFAVHPKYATSESVELAINALAIAQNPEGNWIPGIPFFKTLNMLAHLNMPQAYRQFERALRKLIMTQSPEGSWGKVEPEWSTFLVVHALKRKGIL
jgi:hypothetical protein